MMTLRCRLIDILTLVVLLSLALAFTSGRRELFFVLLTTGAPFAVAELLNLEMDGVVAWWQRALRLVSAFLIVPAIGALVLGGLGLLAWGLDLGAYSPWPCLAGVGTGWAGIELYVDLPRLEHAVRARSSRLPMAPTPQRTGPGPAEGGTRGDHE